MCESSEVVPGIGAVERFVAEREIGDDVALDHRLEQRPLEPGRVAEMAAEHAAIVAQPDRGEDVAPESLDDPKAFAGPGRHHDANRSARQIAEDSEQPEAL